MPTRKTASERGDYALGQVAVLTMAVKSLISHADPVVQQALQAIDDEFLQRRTTHLSSMSPAYQDGVRDVLKLLSGS